MEIMVQGCITGIIKTNVQFNELFVTTFVRGHIWYRLSGAVSTTVLLSAEINGFKSETTELYCNKFMNIDLRLNTTDSLKSNI